MHCRLIVPGLFRTEARARSAVTPQLELLIARGRKTLGSSDSVEHWLLERFGSSIDPPPIAPIAFAGDGGDPRDATWMCADPVHLAVDRDRLVLFDPGSIELHEAIELAGSLNRHFASEGFEINTPTANRWYLRLPAPARATMHTLGAVRGHAIDAALPQGEDGAAWRSRLTEAQMLLHEHPVNQAREARGAALINSLWFWGQGVVPALITPRIVRVASDNPVARGLARLCAIPHTPLPSGASDLMQTGDGVVLAVLEDAERSADEAQWRAAVESLERRFFAPLVEALRAGRIGMVTIDAPAESSVLSVEVTASDLRRFWRRARPLESYISR